MVDQVNPTGNLAPGLPPTTSQALAASGTAHRSSSVQESTPKPSPQPSGPLGLDGKVLPISPATPAKTLASAAQDLQDYLQQLPSELQFRVDKGSGDFYFKVLDPATQKVIRQIPSEEVLATARKLRELADPKSASGVLMDQEG